jgi:hypothetical protein
LRGKQTNKRCSAWQMLCWLLVSSLVPLARLLRERWPWVCPGIGLRLGASMNCQTEKTGFRMELTRKLHPPQWDKLAVTINGLCKAGVTRRRRPWRSFEAVGFATLEWVDWLSHRQLLEPIGNTSPAGASDEKTKPVRPRRGPSTAATP